MTVDPKRRWLQYTLRIALAVICVVAVVAVAKYGLGRWTAYQYPYGWSHCCDKQIGIALFEYAAEHAGKYPTGGTTPEASLGLLYPRYLDANTLRGKIVSLDAVQRQLDSGQSLTPETCGWHYEDGLTAIPEFSSNVAIVWDKVGLDHNGRRLPHGGRSVLFMDGAPRVIKESDWDHFLAEQQNAWSIIRQGGRLAEAPWVPEDR